jgi:hypothetical protein
MFKQLGAILCGQRLRFCDERRLPRFVEPGRSRGASGNRHADFEKKFSWPAGEQVQNIRTGLAEAL